MEHDTVACACFFFQFFFFLSACAPHASLPPPPVCAADGWEEGGRGGGGEGGSVETGKIKRCMMDAVIASETTERIINPPVLLPHPPRPHPPLMESLPCLSRRRRKLAGSARRQPRPPGRLDPLIRSRRWKPEVGWSTDGGDPHPSSLHPHGVGEESGQNQDGGGGGGRLDCRMDEDQSATIRPRCRGFTLSTT